ncbi:MAG: hypothetical protein N2747_03870 [Chitinophagaceae bacterium]|nr:hypothetical protein [Chitinophagaceae bacterium]
MPYKGSIQYILHKDIERNKWDNCILHSPNGLIYGFSYYLDIVCDEWDALVYNDYEAVMPLPRKKKWGIQYLFQPFVTAQLGIFGDKLTVSLMEEFIRSVPSSFRVTEIPLNFGNTVLAERLSFRLRNNFVLNLNRSYSEIRKRYNENLKRNIRKAETSSFEWHKEIGIEQVLAIALPQMKKYEKNVEEKFNRFQKLFAFLHQKKQATSCAVSIKQKILSVCVFFFSHNRAYYILAANLPESRNTGTSHTLIDCFIREHAEENLLLDFEGSDISTLASFYQSFGACNEPFPYLQVNKLPFFMRWIHTLRRSSLSLSFDLFSG